MHGPAVAFIVPVHNRGDLAEPMLRALLATTSTIGGTEYLVVDDGSDEETRKTLASLPPPVRVFRNAESRGFGPALNAAIAETTAPQVVFLNSDLVLTPGWLEPMLEVARTHPAAFAIGNVQTAVSDGSIDHAGVVFHHEGYPIHFRAHPDFVGRRPWREFPAITGACMVVRRDRFLALWGFDDRFRNGFEDIDLCLRARARGWPSFVANRSIVGHHISASPGRKDYEDLNATRFLERWRPLTAIWQRDWENRLLRERRAHEEGLNCTSQPPARSSTSIRVLVDLAAHAPGDGHGDLVGFCGATLRALHAAAPEQFRFLIAAPARVARRLRPLLDSTDELWVCPWNENADARAEPGTFILPGAPDASLPRTLDADIVYRPLGVSSFHSPDIPQVMHVADLIHREEPACISPAEAAARDTSCDRMLAASALIHCSTHWMAARLKAHYGIADGRITIARTHVPLEAADDRATAPSAQAHFVYRAEADADQNHGTLLVAYRLYRIRAGQEAWDLTLVGAPTESMRRVEAHAAALGVAEHVRVIDPAELDASTDPCRHAGAALCPWLHDGTGTRVFDAVRRGLPIVGARSDVLEELAGDAFVATDVRHPTSLATALLEISTRADLRRSLAARSAAHVARLGHEAPAGVLAERLREIVANFRTAGITWRWDASDMAYARRL